MLTKLTQKYKLQLLQKSAKKGTVTFIKQVRLVTLDTIWREKHLVFEISSGDFKKETEKPALELQYKRIETKEELDGLDESIRTEIEETRDWGSPEWLDLRWSLHLWARDQNVVGLIWMRGADTSNGYFIAPPAGSKIIWHAVVLPVFRGDNLFSHLLKDLMRKEGIQDGGRFFINCRDFNTPSQKSILKAGFHMIGFAKRNKFTRRILWTPLT